ncbi:Rrf2 family transcriptional regulator [Legionella pneumophila serogroup 1]|uniref:Rrf2 family transcriptional regulator n=1 Tax=Legionella pneumophila TaxID=446 RepID=UPI0005B3F20E|nr:Rrf2 family transcriptional regulator [Legionella pneumophila]MDW9036062.1 Rrf2 family transcriptional regulator [Legionella pneumophila subsp. fraseri]AMV15515.1 HTH-type transcriptional repressor NsrR [Legionella pneumophila]ANN93578.1 BadM/Rrf2 family transcriptional regulator [Legionella pneumophila]MCH9108065.1 Rrf2 family transcriptional regulator [Legionella pneumophila serogroup 1]MCZ4679652.1 Rrf2 family transcriptional regulator [Legionella pneumophila]
MQLTQFTDYSLRALIYIALKKGSCTIKDITDAYSISNNHLIKIIHNLSKMGLIKTMRGKNGGILMAASPETINLGQLIMELEPNFDLVPCFNKEKANCCIAPACKLKSVLYEAQRAFLQILEQYTLADVLHNPSELSVLLRIS